MNEDLQSNVQAALAEVRARLIAVDTALQNELSVVQEIDRREPRTMAALRAKFDLPHKLALVATSFGDLCAALGTFSNELDEFLRHANSSESNPSKAAQGASDLTAALEQLSEKLGPKSSTEV